MPGGVQQRAKKKGMKEAMASFFKGKNEKDHY
jgi:hypothetical protein